jgi:hypothetical protein
MLAILVCGLPTFAGIVWSNVTIANSGVSYDTTDSCCQIDAIYDGLGLAAVGDAYTPNEDWTTYFSGTPVHTYCSFYEAGACAIGNSSPNTNGSQDYEWFSNYGTTTATIVLNMGEAIPITDIALWNEDSIGVATMDVLVCTGYSGGANGVGTGCTDVGTFDPTANPYGENYAAQFFTPTSIVTGQYVELEVTAPGGATQVSMGAIAFETTIPEPGTWLLLGVGLAALGLGRWMWQRRVVKFSSNVVKLRIAGGLAHNELSD